MLTPFCVLLRSEPNAECDVGEPINGVVAGFPVFIIEMIELPGYVDEKIFPVSCNRKASVNVVVNVSVCRFFPVARDVFGVVVYLIKVESGMVENGYHWHEQAIDEPTFTRDIVIGVAKSQIPLCDFKASDVVHHRDDMCVLNMGIIEIGEVSHGSHDERSC